MSVPRSLLPRISGRSQFLGAELQDAGDRSLANLEAFPAKWNEAMNMGKVAEYFLDPLKLPPELVNLNAIVYDRRSTGDEYPSSMKSVTNNNISRMTEAIGLITNFDKPFVYATGERRVHVGVSRCNYVSLSAYTRRLISCTTIEELFKVITRIRSAGVELDGSAGEYSGWMRYENRFQRVMVSYKRFNYYGFNPQRIQSVVDALMTAVNQIATYTMQSAGLTQSHTIDAYDTSMMRSVLSYVINAVIPKVSSMYNHTFLTTVKYIGLDHTGRFEDPKVRNTSLDELNQYPVIAIGAEFAAPIIDKMNQTIFINEKTKSAARDEGKLTSEYENYLNELSRRADLIISRLDREKGGAIGIGDYISIIWDYTSLYAYSQSINLAKEISRKEDPSHVPTTMDKETYIDPRKNPNLVFDQALSDTRHYPVFRFIGTPIAGYPEIVERPDLAHEYPHYKKAPQIIQSVTARPIGPAGGWIPLSMEDEEGSLLVPALAVLGVAAYAYTQFR